MTLQTNAQDVDLVFRGFSGSYSLDVQRTLQIQLAVVLCSLHHSTKRLERRGLVGKFWVYHPQLGPNHAWFLSIQSWLPFLWCTRGWQAYGMVKSGCASEGLWLKYVEIAQHTISESPYFVYNTLHSTSSRHTGELRIFCLTLSSNTSWIWTWLRLNVNLVQQCFSRLFVLYLTQDICIRTWNESLGGFNSINYSAQFTIRLLENNFKIKYVWSLREVGETTPKKPSDIPHVRSHTGISVLNLLHESLPRTETHFNLSFFLKYIITLSS